MNKEEKKVFERLNYQYKKMIDNTDVLFPLDKGQINILINLIDKLQKENEELKEELEENSISKDIIRDKIKELEEIEKQLEFINNDSYARKRNKDFIIMLKGLLGE